jgi:stringent starvation protein B
MSSSPEGMTSNRPYLLRALYEWITDNGLTPHILVDAEVDGVNVPDHVIQKGKVVLNIADGATEQLMLDNEIIDFKARFSGNPYQMPATLATIWYSVTNFANPQSTAPLRNQA